jgi:hypothetical protein
MSHPYSLPPLPARPLPKLPENDGATHEDREPVVLVSFATPRELLAETMRLEIEQRFQEVLDARH